MHQAQMQQIKNYRRVASVVTAGVVLLSGITTLWAQPHNSHAQTATAPANQNNQQLMNQIAELRAQAERLQAAVHQISPVKKPGPSSGMPMGAGKGMGMMADMGEMGEMDGMKQGSGMGMKDDHAEMSDRAAGGNNKMAAPAKAMGMCCMGAMGMPPSGGGGMHATSPPSGRSGMDHSSSSMLGQPSAPHLLHIGSTGFFLDHSQDISLTANQKSRLNRLKEKALLDQASKQSKIDQAEQELYTLTGAGQRDNSKVQAKIREIEKLRTEQRMNFIQAVDEASNVLTHDQHQTLMGMMAADKK